MPGLSHRPPRVAVGLGFLIAALLVCAAPAFSESTQRAGSANAIHHCHGKVVYGPSTIKVRQTRGVSCPRAKRLARAAVVHRVSKGFPTQFCKRGYCWRFGEPEGLGPGSSRIPFTGQRGDRRIAAVQLVS